MAAPADDTQVQKFALAGGGNDFVPASGALSGTVSAYPGPWYVERQTLDIFYVRVPQEAYYNNTCNTTLSGATTTHSNILNTQLMIYYNASYDTTISYQNYNLSSVQQPQVFTVFPASGDANGVSYGSVNASTLGPMGSILTTQPYIRRTPYTGASSQPLVSRVSTGSNFSILFSSCVVPTFTQIQDATQYQTAYNFWKQNGSKVAVGNGWPFEGLNPYTAYNLYTIFGAYDTSKEFLVNIRPIVDYVGNFITNESHFKWPLANPDPNNFNVPLMDEGFVEYDVNRHA